MKRSHILATVFCFGFLVLFQANLFSQNTSNSSDGSTESSRALNFSTELGGFYFQDLNGTRIALEGVPYENSIDEDQYMLGVNDLITIEIESTQLFVFKNLVINSSGDILIPASGLIELNGLTVSKAEEKLATIFSKTYKSPKVNLTVDIPRKINVYVSGSVPNPGRFTIPAQSRVDLAILQSIYRLENNRDSEAFLFSTYTSQLLNNNVYSIRNITINHSDGTSSTADLVDYFRTGDLNSNPIVRNGDRIIIPRVSEFTPVVSISGAVQYGYELDYKEGETIADLLEISEYFSENADTTKVYVFHQTTEGVERKVIDSSEYNSYTLKPNDRVIVPENNTTRTTSSVRVSGEIEIPGNYPIIAGQTNLSELLNTAGGLKPTALPKAAYLLRSGYIENEIPNKFNSELMSRTSDQFIQGIEYLKQETELSKNRVYIDLTQPEELQSVVLFDGDRLYIPRDEQTIFVFGQVNNPGYFPFINNDSFEVSDYIKRAGGFSLSANKDRVFIIKAGISSWHKPGETDLESGDRIFVDRNPVEDLNAFRTYEVQKQQVRNTRIQLVMTALTTITSIITAYVAVTRN